MIRTLLWLFGGVVLGAVIHLVVILILPALRAAMTSGTRVAAIDALDKPHRPARRAAGRSPIRCGSIPN